MIRVTVFRKKGQITAFELTGHADSGPYGYDLVCAGVSAVSFGAVNAVMELLKADLEINQGDEGGYLKVSIPENIKPDTSRDIQLLLEGMIVSLQSIELEYSEFIKITDKVV